jgi:hypothetical protein
VNLKIGNFTRADGDVNNKAKVSLFVLWVFAASACIAMLLFNNITFGMAADESGSGEVGVLIELKSNDTFDAVSGPEKNRKNFFLTRLPITQPGAATQKAKEDVRVLVIRPGKKVKIEKNDDFEIKAVPN